MLAKSVKKNLWVKIQFFTASTDLALLFRVLGLFAKNVTGSLKILYIEELLFICPARSLKSFNYILDCGVINALVMWNPHLILTEDFVHVNVVYTITVTDFFVRAFQSLGILRFVLIFLGVKLSNLYCRFLSSSLFNSLKRLALVYQHLEPLFPFRTVTIGWCQIGNLRQLNCFLGNYVAVSFSVFCHYLLHQDSLQLNQKVIAHIIIHGYELLGDDLHELVDVFLTSCVGRGVRISVGLIWGTLLAV